MLLIAGQTVGPNGLKFLWTLMGGRGMFKAKKSRKFFTSTKIGNTDQTKWLRRRRWSDIRNSSSSTTSPCTRETRCWSRSWSRPRRQCLSNPWNLDTWVRPRQSCLVNFLVSLVTIPRSAKVTLCNALNKWICFKEHCILSRSFPYFQVTVTL